MYGEGSNGVNTGSGDVNTLNGSWEEGMTAYGGGGGMGRDGQKGCIRLLFGAGRAFPSTNTHDIE